MASNLQFISNGTNYYLAYGTSTPYTGSGTPWTAQATTPFQLAMNDVTGPRWTPQAAVPSRMWAPGPNVPTLIAADTQYDVVVTTTLPIQVRGTTKENCYDALQTLMRALDNSAVGLPAQFAIKPHGVTNVAYLEILSAIWQDNPISTYGEEGRLGTLLRGTLTLTAQPFGSLDGGASAGDTLLGGVTAGNAAVQSLGSSGTGDLAVEGQPMNVYASPSVTTARFYLASVYSRQNQSSGFSAVSVSTTPTTVGTATLNVADLLTRPTLACRLLIGVTSTGATSPTIDRLTISLALNSGPTYYSFEAPVLSLNATGTGARLIDCGEIPIPAAPFDGHNTSTLNLNVTVQAVSAFSTVNMTLAFIQTILYWEFCTISGLSVTSSNAAYIMSYPVQSGRTLLPLAEPVAMELITASTSGPRGVLEGQAPKYRRGASLWLGMATEDINGGLANFSATATVYAKQAPLWRATRAD